MESNQKGRCRGVYIDDEDYAYCKNTGIKPSRILRKAIKELRQGNEDGIDWQFACNRWREKYEQLHEEVEALKTLSKN